MMGFFNEVYGTHSYLLKFGQKFNLFSEIHLCMDVLLEMVREDILTTYFGSNW